MSGAMAVSSVCLSVTLIHCVRMHIKCGSVYLLVYFHQIIRFTSGKDQNVTHQVTHQVEALPKGGLAQPPKINSQNMTVHDPSVCVASVVFQVHS